MFELEYKGGNAVLITTKSKALLIDGNVSQLGLKEVSIANVVDIATERRFLPEAKEGRIQLEGPGEYEVGPFSVRGVPAKRMIDGDGSFGSTMYRVEIGDISLAILGNVEHAISEDQLEALGVVDLVVIPIGGGGYTLDATDAVRLVKMIEPKAIIPVHYSDPSISYEVPQESIERFVSELGVPVEDMQKLKIKSPSALPATMTIYQIARS